jgi:glyoxylase-like metal-dependent hydrolase (beta-lactamase superfamily II)
VNDIRIETFPVGPLACNCSIVFDSAAGVAGVIDPGGDFNEIRTRIERAKARVAVILHTHAHIDHVGATAELQRWSGAPARLHRADRFLFDMLAVQAAMVGLPSAETFDLSDYLADGATVAIGSFELTVAHTPGHSPGSVVLVGKANGKPVVFAGDTLFRGGVGRSDLWGGDGAALIRSIRTRLLTLADETVVVTGHGPSTTIGEERRSNPFPT